MNRSSPQLSTKRNARLDELTEPVIDDSALEPYACPDCGKLLFRGHLEKGTVLQVMCQKCTKYRLKQTHRNEPVLVKVLAL